MKSILGTLAILGALCGIALVFGDVHARTVDADRSACGSALTVFHRGNGYEGGELRPDEASFDAACVAGARQHLYLAIIPSVVLGGASLGLVLINRRRNYVTRPSNAFQI